mmetsp:Transcript_138163/g.243768  ORF Transcript_138163/g.243768 Transcript_138163/m.243768 type:complete len:388 (+) Transcript_138163:476-1639(+)
MSQSPTAPPPLQTPKGSQTRNPRGDLQSHLSQGQSLRRGKPANLSSPKLSAVSVEEVYAHFCGGHAETEMDCKSFLKMCKRSGLIDRTFTSQDASLIFAAVVHVSKQRMDFHSFKAAIGRVAVRKGIDVNLVRRMVAWSIQSGADSEASLKQSAPKSPAPGDESTSRTWPEQACNKLNLSAFMSGSASSLCTASSLSTFRRSQSGTVLQREQEHPASLVPVSVYAESVQPEALDMTDYYMQQVADAVQKCASELLNHEYTVDVKTVKVASSNNWTIEVAIKLGCESIPESFQDICFAAKEALIKALQFAENVIIMGSRSPFVQQHNGFEVTLGVTRKKSNACWDLCSKGLCHRDLACRWEHPEFYSKVAVFVVSHDTLNGVFSDFSF